MHDELLSIGRFAQLCRLTVKQLRHYDALGLLAPARVDAATGYRFYRRDQVRDAMAIALMRTLDLPLPVIAQALRADGAQRAFVLRGERDRLAAQLARRERSLQALDRLLTEGLLKPQVTLATEPARRLVVAHEAGEPEQIAAATGRAIGRLMAGLAGVDWSPPVWGLFPTDLDAPLGVTVGVELRSADDRSVLELPGGPVAVVTHVGPYEQLPLTYAALFAWVHERGLRPDRLVREAYLTDPTSTDPDQLLTRIVLPINDGEQ